ncbi:TACR3 [Lepeophtheirus salmonis]|uniref:TACR3 n=1 Tax=Lepeophtheirus salmonis TaxID=72036 RepID=A0A7R8CEU1_LEPSM|nr:TACR3 [Lepeophtheirus salmonis]CAF2794272.1 TACR3 [Lepeophtheirus salmonis]
MNRSTPNVSSFLEEMELSTRVIWDSLFISLIFVAILGNLIVLWIVVAHRSMWTIPNIYIANMSLSDLLMATLNCVFNYIFMRDRYWSFGSAYCSINNFMAIVTISASVLNLTAMSLDRYKAVVWPLKGRTNRVCVTFTIIFIWATSSLLALPTLLYSKLTKDPSKGLSVCHLQWPDGNPGYSYFDHVYNVTIFIITYVIPTLILVMCTSHMSIALWCKPTIGFMTPQLERAKRKKTKDVIKMKNIQHIFLLFYWFAMTHSGVNPVVYYLMNPRFRRFYRHFVTLRFLKRSAHNTSTGLILASSFGFQVAAQLTYNIEESTCNSKQSVGVKNVRNSSSIVDKKNRDTHL